MYGVFVRARACVFLTSMHIQTDPHVHTYAYANTHAHVHTHTQIYIYACTNTHAHTHADAHAHAHAPCPRSGEISSGAAPAMRHAGKSDIEHACTNPSVD